MIDLIIYFVLSVSTTMVTINTKDDGLLRWAWKIMLVVEQLDCDGVFLRMVPLPEKK